MVCYFYRGKESSYKFSIFFLNWVIIDDGLIRWDNRWIFVVLSTKLREGERLWGCCPVLSMRAWIQSVCAALAYWNANEARTPARATQNKKPGQIPPSALHHFVLHVRTWKGYFRLKDVFNGLINSFLTDQNCSLILLLFLTFAVRVHARRLDSLFCFLLSYFIFY